jgi:hypothetical protein
MHGDEKLPRLKTLQAEQQRLLEEQQRFYDKRAKLKKETRVINTMRVNATTSSARQSRRIVIRNEVANSSK